MDAVVQQSPTILALARRRSRWGVVAGVVLGCTALWLAVRGVQWADLAASFARLNYGWSLAAVASTLGTLLVSTLRWRVLFHPDERDQRLSALFRGVVIGQMLNIVLPIRVGEIARTYDFASTGKVSKTRVLATLAVEKALDLGTFAVAIVVSLSLVVFPHGVRLQQRALWIIGVGGAVGLWLLARFGPSVDHWLRRLGGRLPERWQETTTAHVERFLQGLCSLRSSRASLAAVGLSILLVGLGASTNYLLFRAFNLDLSFVVALFLLVLLQVGSVPPSLPGRVGIFNYLTAVGLAAFGVDRSVAFSYSIVLYAVGLLPRVIVGAVYLAVTPKWSLSVFRRADTLVPASLKTRPTTGSTRR